MKVPWTHLIVGVTCLGAGISVGRGLGAHVPPSPVSVNAPDAGVATARVTSSGGQEVASILCRVEQPPPPSKPVVRTIYVKGEPVTVACPEPTPCPALLCEGTASTRPGSLSAQADSPVLPPAIMTVTPHESPRRWGIGPALGVSSELELRPGVGAAWQPTPAIEVHGNVVWTGVGKIPVAVTGDVLFRF